jgi:hypothetical protein
MCVLPSIRRKGHRDIGCTLGASMLRFGGLTLCIAKPKESSMAGTDTGPQHNR